MISEPETPGEWRFFPCTMGEDTAFVYLNVSLSKSITHVPSSLAKLKLTYKNPHPNGLPTNDEFEVVSQLEEQIDKFSKEEGDWYVGRITVSGHRHFYIYTGRVKSAWRDFVARLRDDSSYEISLSFRNDPDHRGYYDELYPTEDDWQVIKDLQVIENLESHGDDGSEPRKVDHWVYFPDKASSVDFIIWAEKDCFTEEPEHSHESEDGKYCVRLFHHGTIKIGDISSHTILLRRKAAEYGGDYDGWETPILK